MLRLPVARASIPGGDKDESRREFSGAVTATGVQPSHATAGRRGRLKEERLALQETGHARPVSRLSPETTSATEAAAHGVLFHCRHHRPRAVARATPSTVAVQSRFAANFWVLQ